MTGPPLVAPADLDGPLHTLEQPVAVTGGTGFVGSHLVDTLVAAGLRPRVLVRDPASPRWIAGADVEWVAGDLGSTESLDRLVDGAKTVFHLAGVVRAGSAAEFDTANRVGTAAVARAVSRRAGEDARLVHVSSLAAVGPSDSIEGVTPDAEPRPVSGYGRSKLGGEREVRSLDRGVRWVIVRPPAVYGPRDTDVLQFFQMASRGFALIPGGERWLTVAYVADVVRALVLASVGEGAVGRVLHLGEEQPYRLQALIRLVGATGGRRVRVASVPPVVVRAAGAVGSALQRLGRRRVALTSDKVTELLARHWTARTAASHELIGLDEATPFVDGADVTWRWYRDRGWTR